MTSAPAGPQRVAVVTDSTSYLPAGVAAELGVRVVPLRVQLGPRTGPEGLEVGPAELTRALRDRVIVTTSRPTPGEFALVFRQALADGATSVLSVHLSAELSGTCDSARLATSGFDTDRIRVLDSRSTAMGLGFGVLAAARAAAGGADLDGCERAAQTTLDGTTARFYVDSLDYLRRGGRIGTAAARFGTALAVKPLLHVSDGQILPLEKVRTASKAIARLVELTVAAAGTEPVDIAVQHLAAPERAADLVSQIRRALPGVREVYESEVGAVVGAHVGPGLLGIVVSRV